MNKIDIKIIMQIINKANPLGLFVDNKSNFDEFKPEAEEIKKIIESIPISELTDEQVRKIVNDVFHSFFEGVEIKQEELDEVSKQLLKEL